MHHALIPPFHDLLVVPALMPCIEVGPRAHVSLYPMEGHQPDVTVSGLPFWLLLMADLCDSCTAQDLLRRVSTFQDA